MIVERTRSPSSRPITLSMYRNAVRGRRTSRMPSPGGVASPKKPRHAQEGPVKTLGDPVLLSRASGACDQSERRFEMHDPEAWPALPLQAWKDTCDTLHMWMQIVGKISLKLTPHLNHWWELPLYLTSRGLTTTPMPFGARPCAATFDFIDDVP